MSGPLLALLGLWILLGAVWLAVWPLLAGRGVAVVVDALELQELQAEKARLVGEIHELELDRATGKLSEEDYAAGERRLKGRAVEVMREIERKAGA